MITPADHIAVGGQGTRVSGSRGDIDDGIATEVDAACVGRPREYREHPAAQPLAGALVQVIQPEEPPQW